MHKQYRLLFISAKKKREEKMQTRIQTHNKYEQYWLLFICAKKKICKTVKCKLRSKRTRCEFLKSWKKKKKSKKKEYISFT